MNWLNWFVIALGLLAALLLVALIYGASRWEAGTRKLEALLEAGRRPVTPARFALTELEGLPAPVQRYFRVALREGQRMVTAVTIEHAGTFNIGEADDSWKPFTSSQRVTTQRPGFVWDGKVAMMPGLPVRVHDAYVAGEGILRPAVLGLITLLNLRGKGDIAQGEAMRYLAETAWYPTALLPGQGVEWAPVDERSASATLQDGELSVTLLFRFNDEGLIESVRAESRGRTVRGKVVATPWEGRWWDYVTHEGMRVPRQGEVAWHLPAGPRPYWRGRVTRLEYEYAP